MVGPLLHLRQGPDMDDIATLIARIDALEARVAHQDRAIEDLNETITGPWKEIDSPTRHTWRVGHQWQEWGMRAPDAPSRRPRIIDPPRFAHGTDAPPSGAPAAQG